MLSIIIVGATFCHVVMRSPWISFTPLITSGNHVWNGAMLNLKKSALVSMIPFIFSIGFLISHVPFVHTFIRADLRMVAAARACIKKYFIAASIFRGSCI